MPKWAVCHIICCMCICICWFCHAAWAAWLCHAARAACSECICICWFCHAAWAACSECICICWFCHAAWAACWECICICWFWAGCSEAWLCNDAWLCPEPWLCWECLFQGGLKSREPLSCSPIISTAAWTAGVVPITRITACEATGWSFRWCLSAQEWKFGKMFGYGLATIKCNKVWSELRYQIWWKLPCLIAGKGRGVFSLLASSRAKVRICPKTAEVKGPAKTCHKEAERFGWKSVYPERAVATSKWGRATGAQNCLPGSVRIQVVPGRAGGGSLI